MKKLIIASALLALSALPVLAKPNDPYSSDWNYGEHEPERRVRHAQEDEILSDCVNTNKNLYCADEYEGGGIMEINDTVLYERCSALGCIEVEGELFIRSESGRLIQVNPGNE